MCGIIGTVTRRVELQEDLEESGRRALEVMAYRGPDDLDLVSLPGVVLGNVRLAIIDRTGGKQPMQDPETGLQLVFNGMIYNYLELRRDLEKLGYHFRTQSDTEVLLKAYLHYGTKVVDHLNGMFAFAVYNPEDHSLFCARDPLGIKPLYFKADKEKCIFASEIKSLVTLDGKPVEANPQAVADYIHLQYALGDKTFFKGIGKLLPGHCLRYRDGHLETWPYWEPVPVETFRGDYAQAADELRSLMEEAVRWQIRSDVSLGTHLSGGLDTGIVSALAIRLTDNLKTFTAAFREGGVFDDSEAARTTAKFIGSEHFETYPNHEDFAANYERLVYHLDEPVAAPGVFAQYIVSKLAKKQVTVVLGGQGADEIFGGYTRYYMLLLDQAIRSGAEQGKANIGLSWDELGQGLGQLNQYGSLWQRMQTQEAFEDPVKRYWTLIDRSDGLGEHLNPEFINGLNGYETFDEYAAVMMRFRDAELLNRVLYFETTSWLPALLQVEDRMSMACSLESRVPILDRRIVDFACSLPTAIKMHRGRTKAIMREAFTDLLAPTIRDRRDKIGFPVPVNRWFGGPLRDFVGDILGSQEALQRGIFPASTLREMAENPGGDNSRALWGMLNIELWFRNFVNGR